MKEFLTGIVTAVAIGYLTVPRPGQETRHQLTQAEGQQTNGVKDYTWMNEADVNKAADALTR